MLLQAAAVAIALAAAASIIGYWWRTGITPTPGSPAACRAMLAAADDAPPGTILELGSGWGMLAIAAARRWPDRQVIGYELSWVPWLVGCTMQRLLRLPNLSFRREDLLKATLPPAAVWLCYLHRRAMQGLAGRLQEPRARPGMLVSNTFALRGIEPERELRLADLYRTRIYVYRWPAGG